MTKKLLLGLGARCLLLVTVCVACLALAGCAHSAIPPASTPATIADRTVLDEKAMAGVELAYRSMRIALETAVDAGLLKGGAALVAAQMDLRAETAVEAVHSAYQAGNAQSYDQAIAQAFDAIEAARDVIKGD